VLLLAAAAPAAAPIVPGRTGGEGETTAAGGLPAEAPALAPRGEGPWRP